VNRISFGDPVDGVSVPKRNPRKPTALNVPAIFAEEIRLYILCIWLGILVISRLNVYWLYRELRKEILSQGTPSVWSLKR